MRPSPLPLSFWSASPVIMPPADASRTDHLHPCNQWPLSQGPDNKKTGCPAERKTCLLLLGSPHGSKEHIGSSEATEPVPPCMSGYGRMGWTPPELVVGGIRSDVFAFSSPPAHTWTFCASRSSALRHLSPPLTVMLALPASTPLPTILQENRSGNCFFDVGILGQLHSACALWPTA